jgi:hypothetical protein
MEKLKIPKIVAAGIDTLNVGFYIAKWQFNETVFKQLEDAKCGAGISLFGGKGITVELGGCKFNMLAKGTKGYEFVMSNDDVRLCLARDGQSGRVFPEVFAEFNSSYLWGKGYDRAYYEFKRWLDTIAVVVGEKVNRADPCVDIAVALPKIDVARDVVTRAVNRSDYCQVEHYTRGRRDTGYRIGGGDVMTRIYDKGREIMLSHKAYFLDIWRNGGWDGKSDVTRIENQVRRPYLKKYKVDSYADLVKFLPDIWRVITTERLVLKNPSETDSNHRRWKTSELWTVVQEACDYFGNCLGVQPWKQKQARTKPLIAQMEGLMASEVALDSGIRGEYHAIMRLKSIISRYLDSEEFRIKVLQRRGRYGNISDHLI